MAETTGISWCHATLNFWVGCTKVSNGPKGACEHCYAESWAKRWPAFRKTWGAGAARVLFKHLVPKALALERIAKESGEPFYCFSNSLSDIFDNEVPIEWLAEAFRIMRLAPHVTFLLLTKRAPNILKRTLEAGGLPQNVALGITVVTQEEADRDVPHLLAAAARLKPLFTFLSMEPLMGPVDLTRLSTMAFRGAECLNALTGELSGIMGEPAGYLPAIGWVITGGESGSKARVSHHDWYRAIRDQCEPVGTPYHHKQHGEWREAEEGDDFDTALGRAGKPPAFIVDPADGAVHCFLPERPNPRNRVMVRVGKKAAGRALDGVIHDAMPVAA